VTWRPPPTPSRPTSGDSSPASGEHQGSGRVRPPEAGFRSSANAL
jgi:hypothetical protein